MQATAVEFGILLVSSVLAVGGTVTVWGMGFFWHTLATVIPVKHNWNGQAMTLGKKKSENNCVLNMPGFWSFGDLTKEIFFTLAVF